jgi:hypothetical protein
MKVSDEFTVPLAVAITGNCIRSAMRLPGGTNARSTPWRPPANFGRRATQNAQQKAKKPIPLVMFEIVDDSTSKSLSKYMVGRDKQNGS